MVFIRDCDNMFWGVTIDAGKRYSQVVKQGFHVSMAALESNAKKAGENVQVLLQHESSEYLLCTLNNQTLQQPLDLNFVAGEQISFSLNGSGVVHLTGYAIPDIPEDDSDFDEEESMTESDEEIPSLVDVSLDGKIKQGGKRKVAEKNGQAPKKIKLSESIDEEEDEDDDSEDEEEFSDDFGDEFGDSDDDDDEDEEDDEKDETPIKKAQTKTSTKAGAQTPAKAVVQTPQQKKPDAKTPTQSSASQKQDGKSPKNPQNQKTPATPVQPDQKATSETPVDESGKKKKRKKKKNKNKEGNSTQNDSTSDTTGATTPTPKTEATPKKRVVAGGTVVEDLKVGHGPEAKPGKMASVYYVGTLAKNNKRFDSCTDGKPFRFRLNQGEVIKGWDNGVLGMKVGGKRKITVPASQAYGNVKQGPIPPNSTLVFEVELKAVS